MPEKYKSGLTAYEIDLALHKIATGEAQGAVQFFDFIQGPDYKEQVLNLPIGMKAFHIANPKVRVPGWKFVKNENDRADWNGEYLIVDEAKSIAFNGCNNNDSEGNVIDVVIENDAIELDNNALFPATVLINKEVNNLYSLRVKKDIIENGLPTGNYEWGDYIYSSKNENRIRFISSIEGYEDMDTFRVEHQLDGSDLIQAALTGTVMRSAASGNRFRLYKNTTYSSQKPVSLYKWIYEDAKETDINKILVNTDGTLEGIQVMDALDDALYYCIGTNKFYHWRTDIQKMVGVGNTGIELGYTENTAYPGNAGSALNDRIEVVNGYLNSLKTMVSNNQLYKHTFTCINNDAAIGFIVQLINHSSEQMNISDLVNLGHAIDNSLKATYKSYGASAGNTVYSSGELILQVSFDTQNMNSITIKLSGEDKNWVINNLTINESVEPVRV